MSEFLPDSEGMASAGPALSGSTREPAPEQSLLRWAIAVSVVCLTAQFLLMTLAESQPERTPLVLAGSVVLGLFISIAPAWIIRRHGQQVFDGTRPLQLGREFLAAVVALVGLLMSLCLVSLLLQHQLAGDADPRAERFEQFQYFGTLPGWVMLFLAACVWAPIFEEIAFRRFIFRAFETRIGQIPAMLVSSGIFAALHAYGLLRTLLIFGVGMALCLVYARRRTLVTPMILHAGFNGFMLLLLLAQSFVLENSPALGINGDETPTGLRITRVTSGLPADIAGLRDGDVLLKLDDSPAPSILSIRRILAKHQVGDVIPATIQRDGVEQNVELRLTHTMAQATAPEDHPPQPE